MFLTFRKMLCGYAVSERALRLVFRGDLYHRLMLMTKGTEHVSQEGNNSKPEMNESLGNGQDRRDGDRTKIMHPATSEWKQRGSWREHLVFMVRNALPLHTAAGPNPIFRDQKNGHKQTCPTVCKCCDGGSSFPKQECLEFCREVGFLKCIRKDQLMRNLHGGRGGSKKPGNLCESPIYKLTYRGGLWSGPQV